MKTYQFKFKTERTSNATSSTEVRATNLSDALRLVRGECGKDIVILGCNEFTNY